MQPESGDDARDWGGIVNFGAEGLLSFAFLRSATTRCIIDGANDWIWSQPPAPGEDLT